MPSFQYEALKLSDRNKVNGVINAANEKEARELLRDQELLPTQIKVIASADSRSKKGFNLSDAILSPFKGISTKDKIAFTRNMTMMIKAGVPVTEALMYFENYAQNPKFRKVISRIRSDILSGYSLSQALSKHTKLFNEVFINVVKAGETSGELERTLERLTDLMVKGDKLKMKITSAAVYPVIILCIVSIVLLIMFLLVLPTFEEIYQKMGVDLPLITQIMLGISKALKSYWFVSFPAMGASLFGIYKYLTSAAGKALMDVVFLKVPVLGELVKYINNSHYVSTLLVSFGAGVPITEALYMAAQTVNNNIIREAFMGVQVKIQAGQKLALCLAETNQMPELVLLMISIGEESGELEKMFESSFEYLEDEINHRVELLTAMMEPVMLLVLGVIVGTIALAVYMPMFSIYDNI